MLSKRNIKILLGVVGALVLVTLGKSEGVFLVNIAHAQPVPNAADTFINQLTQLVGMLMTALNVLAWMLFKALDLVMDPDFMFARPAGGGEGALLNMLHDIWQLSRDLMNVIFAILLITGAVMTVVNPKGGELLKANAPKFVLAVLFINFSWFAPRVIIDVSNITASTVFSIPSLIGGDCEIPAPAGVKEDPKPCTAIVNVLFFDRTDILKPSKIKKDVFVDPQNQEWRCPVPQVVCYQEKTFKEIDRDGGFPAHTKVINGLVVNFGRLKNLAQLSRPLVVNPNAFQQIGNVIAFLVKMIVVLVIHIALFFPLLAMTVGFFVRIPILWFTMAFMPFAFLGIIIGDKIELDAIKTIWKKFLSAAFLPTMVAIPLAIGFIMINAGLGMKDIPAGIKALNGAIPLFSQMEDMWQVIWLMVALFVLWTGVFTALNKDEIIGKFTKGIQSIGEATAGLAVKAPLAAPIIPASSGKPEDATSILQMKKAFDPRTSLNIINSTGKLPRPSDLLGDDGTDRAKKRIDKVRVDGDINVKTTIEQLVRNDVNVLDVTQDANKTKLKDLMTEMGRDGNVHTPESVAKALKKLNPRLDERVVAEAIKTAQR